MARPQSPPQPCNQFHKPFLMYIFIDEDGINSLIGEFLQQCRKVLLFDFIEGDLDDSCHINVRGDRPL